MYKLSHATILALCFVGAPSAAFEVTNCAARTTFSAQSLAIECDVTNHLESAIASFAVELTAGQTGRTVPWLEQTARVDVAGGIEPTEKINILVATPNISNRANLSEVIWTATPIEAWGIDGQALLQSRDKLTAQEARDLADSIRPCLNLGAVSREAQSSTVEIAFALDAFGRPDIFALQSTSSDMTSAESQLFEAARRAILRCGASGLAAGPVDRVVLLFREGELTVGE
jgi:hypothetical protein